MRAPLCLAALAAVGLALVARPAAAQVPTDFASCSPDLALCDATHDDCCVRSFDPIATDRAIVIPMDRCHQVMAQGGTYSPPTATGSFCSNPGPFSANDNGMFEAYGLVFRLMQNNIPVYWVINPTKDPTALTANQNLSQQTYIVKDIDAWIVSGNATPPSATNTALASCGVGCTPPVALLNPATLAASGAWTYSKKQFPIRGGAFVIAPEDRARFNDFWLKRGAYAGFAGDPNYDFSKVDMYEVQNGAKFVYQDFRSATPYSLGNGGNGAPVAVRIDYQPPRLARLAPAGVSQIWLSMAKLNQPAAYPACKTGAFSPADAVFCDISVSDIAAGTLTAGKFDWSWIDNWSDNTPCATASEIAAVDNLRTFMTAIPGVRQGGHVVLMEAVVDMMERCANRQLMGVPGAGPGLIADNNAPSEPLILRRPHNVFMQWADLPTSFAQGAITRWRYDVAGGGAGYDPAHTNAATGSLVRLVSEDRSAAGNSLCSRHKSTPACDVYSRTGNGDHYDVAAYMRYQDNPANGVVFYMGGNQVNNGPSHLRMVLNTLISVPLATVPQLPQTRTHEVARSSPIVAMTGGVETAYRGTFTMIDPAPVIPVYQSATDDSTFEFPYTKGHYRGIDVADGTVLFDAAEHLPPARASGCPTWFSASCRTIFTNVASGRNPDKVYVSTANRSLLKPLMAPTQTNAEADVLIGRVLAGDKQADGTWAPALGGIDRSTAAVIEPSPLTREPRPTMAYVGALDGMLHAICVDIQGACQARGQELWAFVPRVMLSRLRINDGRIDGSPKVADVYGDLDSDGRREWHTILTFQVGSGQPGVTGFSPAVYAIDVTRPESPRILWEVTPPTTRGRVELGVGTSLAMAPVRTSNGTQNFTFVVSSNGGTGGAGLYVAALKTETGEVAWTWQHEYPGARTGGNPPVPASGIPGGPVAIDRDQIGTAVWVAVPSLYGDVWLLNADTGTSVFGATNPLFRFAADFHPVGVSPTLYRDGSGRLHLALGSGGYTDPVSTSWAPIDVQQWLVSFALEPTTAPINESRPAPDVAFALRLEDGERIYSQLVVAGGELYVTSDRTDVNDSGYGLDENTGRLRRILLSTGAVRDDPAIFSGAGSVDAAGGKVHTTDETGVATADYTSNFDANGASTELSIVSNAGATLWLRLE